MLRYTLLYILLGPILFGLIYFDGFSPLFFLNNLQTKLTIFLTFSGLDLFNLPVATHGDLVLFPSGLILKIHYTCNAMAPILLYTAAIVSYPTDIKSKVYWLIAGYFILVGLNLIRMLLVAYAVIIDPDSFHWAHNYVGRYGMGVLTLCIFYFFTQKVPVLKNTFATKK